MNHLEVALYAAMGCAAISALAGCRTAWVLLAGVVFCFALDWAEVPFNPVLWMLFDLVLVLLILRPEMTPADCVILSLFIPGWVFYQLPDDERYAGALAVTVIQLLLSVSPSEIKSAPARYRAWFASDNKFDKLVAAIRPAGLYA